MTYAIGYFVYGIDLTTSSWTPSEWDEFAETISDLTEQDVLTSQYSGGGAEPCYLGVDLFEIDECTNERPAEWVLEPTADQKADFVKKLAAVGDYLEPDNEQHQAFLAALAKAEPGVLLLWGSS